MDKHIYLLARIFFSLSSSNSIQNCCCFGLVWSVKCVVCVLHLERGYFDNSELFVSIPSIPVYFR